MLEIKDLNIRFGAHLAVREASLSIGRGDRIGVVGESGCGKSLTALAMMGMTPETATVEGSIRLAGREMIGAQESQWRRRRARDIAMIFQEPMSALNPLKTIGAVIAEPLRIHLGLSRRQARSRVLELLAEVGMPDPVSRLAQYPHQLSDGQRQRVLIATALSCDPAILIADEPTTALDATMAAIILDLMVRLAEQRNMALVFISHDLQAVAHATQNMVVMYGGDIVEQGATERVLAHPAHPYTQGLLSARPRINLAEPRRQRLVSIPGMVPALKDMAAGCRFAGRCAIETPSCRRQRPTRIVAGPGCCVLCHLIGSEHSDELVHPVGITAPDTPL